MTGPLRQTGRGLLLDVRATPKASRDEVTGFAPAADGSLSLAVKVTAPPDKGKANEAVARAIAKASGIPKSAIELVSGETDRNKVFAVKSHAEHLQNWLMDLRTGQD